MSEAQDKLHEAIKLVLSEMLNNEKSEVRQLLKDAIYLAIVQDPKVREELITIVRGLIQSDHGPLVESIAETKREIAIAKGLTESALGEIKTLKTTVKKATEPWWQRFTRKE